MKKLALVAASALFLSGCGDDPKAATPENFAKAINLTLAEEQQCVNAGGDIFKVSTSSKSRWAKEDAKMSEILVRLKLLKPTGEAGGYKTYELTEEGKKFYKEKEASARDRMFFGTKSYQVLCYAKREVGKMGVITEPAPNAAGVISSIAEFKLKLTSYADWAKDPEFVKAKGERMIPENVESDHKMRLEQTLDGWVAKPMTRL